MILSDGVSQPVSSTFDVVGFGALNWDSVFRVENLNAGTAGRDSEWVVEAETEAPGGSAANTVYGLAKLGMKCAFIGCVGNDKAGRSILADLRSVDVDTSLIFKKKVPTGEALCLTDRFGRRAISIRPRANSALSARNIAQALRVFESSPPKLVHLSSFAGDQLEMQNALVSKLDVQTRVSCAPGTLYVKRGLDRLMPLLDRCSYLFLNRQEITSLMRLPKEEYEAAAATLFMRLPNCESIVITLGSGHDIPVPPLAVQQLPLIAPPQPSNPAVSAYVLSRGAPAVWVEKSKRSIDVVDGTGAGDAFTAGYLYGVAHGWSVADCGHAAQAAAERSLGALGARAALPSLEELESDISLEQERVLRPTV